MSKKDKKVIIREIPSKVKYIKEVEESDLEKEVEKNEQVFLPETISSDLPVTIIKSEEQIQELPREVPDTPLPKENQELFGESIRYSTSNESPEVAATRRRDARSRAYSAPEESAARINPSISSSFV